MHKIDYSEHLEVCITEDVTQVFHLMGDIQLNVKLCGCR
jgi:hypothetical protein